MSSIDLSQYPAVVKLRRMIVNDVLPVWLDAAHDKTSGHFHEGLTLDGRPLVSGRLRTRTAARVIHVYADAARHGVAPKGALAAAERAALSLERDAALPAGGYGRVINRISGVLLDPVCDLYDQSCVLLALASLYAATGDLSWRVRAEALLAIVDTRLRAPKGGWAQDDGSSLPRGQNPHMHMFEALLALASATQDPDHVERLQSLAQLMQRQFLDRDGVLHEYFGPSWERTPEWGSERLDPGHMAEWAWLLRAASRFIGSDWAEIGDNLLETAFRIGRDPGDTRFLLDVVDVSGCHLGNGRRLWTQIECVKGALATGRLTDAENTSEGLFESYLSNVPRGLWHDAFDDAGNRASKIVPASSCYHLWTLAGGMIEHFAASAATIGP